MTLTEILDEAERLEREYQSSENLASQIVNGNRQGTFYARVGPRLVAVARAAVEMHHHALPLVYEINKVGSPALGTFERFGLALDAFDALASGGEEKAE